MIRRSLIALAAPLLFSGPLLAQEAKLGAKDGKDLPPTEIGRVAVGKEAPDFTLAQHGGDPVSLSSFRGKKNVVLVFYRGHWCPYCMRQLKELRKLLDDEIKKDTELIVIAPQGEKEAGMAKETIARQDGMKPDFTFLMDVDHSVIRRFGILNPGGASRGLPHPATFVIDKKGIVRWKDVQTDYKIRPTNEAIRKAVKALSG